MSMKTEINTALVTLNPRLIPLMCLFSQMIFVGSVAAVKYGI